MTGARSISFKCPHCGCLNFTRIESFTGMNFHMCDSEDEEPCGKIFAVGWTTEPKVRVYAVEEKP